MSLVRTLLAAIALAVVACTDTPVAVETTDLEPQFAQGRLPVCIDITT